jgi:hypothetical protein
MNSTYYSIILFRHSSTKSVSPGTVFAREHFASTPPRTYSVAVAARLPARRCGAGWWRRRRGARGRRGGATRSVASPLTWLTPTRSTLSRRPVVVVPALWHHAGIQRPSLARSTDGGARARARGRYEPRCGPGVRARRLTPCPPRRRRGRADARGPNQHRRREIPLLCLVCHLCV